MGVITSIFARRVIQAAGPGVDQTGFLLSVGLDPNGPMDVGQMLTDEAYYDLVERVARQMDTGYELPLRAGRAMRPNDYGALGLAWKSASTVRDSLDRVVRYCRLWTDTMAYEIEDGPGGAYFLLHRDGDRRLGLRLSNEATAASALSLIRQTASEDAAPDLVCFKHDPPPVRSAHEAYFGCPVVFGADRDALLLSHETLALPNQLGDDGISAFLISHLNAELEKVRPDAGLEDLVRQAVTRSLSEGVPKMGQIARRLGMSERTLQRRLAGEGISFQAIVETARQQLAEALLNQSSYTLSDVAFLTGFSEQSAFNRAFKRWAGTTPAAFRKEPPSHAP